jgi:hypothetical protein
MRDAVAKGWTLEKLSDKKIMNRSIRTLQMRARQFGLSFPDYTPRALKAKWTKADQLVIRSCLMVEIEATAVALRDQPPDPLYGGFRRTDMREEWLVKLKKALAAIEAMRL